MKGGIAKTSFSALSPQFESCRFFCYCKFLEILRLSSASPLLFFFRHCCLTAIICIAIFAAISAGIISSYIHTFNTATP